MELTSQGKSAIEYFSKILKMLVCGMYVRSDVIDWGWVTYEELRYR